MDGKRSCRNQSSGLRAGTWDEAGASRAHGKDHKHDNARHELRKRDERKAGDGDQAVRPFSVIERSEDTETDGGRHDEKECEAPENERVVEPVEGDRRDRTAQQEGVSPLAAHETCEPGPVALKKRTIDTQLVIKSPNLHFSRVGAEDGASDIAGHYLCDKE